MTLAYDYVGPEDHSYSSDEVFLPEGDRKIARRNSLDARMAFALKKQGELLAVPLELEEHEQNIFALIKAKTKYSRNRSVYVQPDSGILTFSYVGDILFQILPTLGFIMSLAGLVVTITLIVENQLTYALSGLLFTFGSAAVAAVSAYIIRRMKKTLLQRGRQSQTKAWLSASYY